MLYFLGIGGIGMSALARYFKAKGSEVAGYDRTATPLTRRLEAEGISIHYVDDPAMIPQDVEFVVLTPAIPADSKELNCLRERGVRIVKRAEVLGMISRQHTSVAVAGSHGKTTTTALVSHILMTARRRFSAFIGGIARNIDSNVVIGDERDEFVVMEADEFDRSFLQLSPNVSIVTSIDADHLDIYGDYQHVVEGFNQFVEKTSDRGLVVYHAGLPVQTSKPHITYGLNDADVVAANIRIVDGMTEFDAVLSGDEVVPIRMALYGDHNVQNALAAIIACKSLGISVKDIQEALLTFKGVQRRFDIRVNHGKHVYIDDYAHHPEEMRATLLTARKAFTGKELTVVFQPHLFTRTRDFMDEFAQVLSLADRVILLDIYPAREKPIAGVTSAEMLKWITAADKMLCLKTELVNVIKNIDPELLITMGAGDINDFVPQIEQLFNE